MITLPLSYVPATQATRSPAPQAQEQAHTLQGATWAEVAPFYPPPDPIRRMERASIRTWMEQHRGLLRGRVLDFGAGTEPYRDLVQGEYVPHEKGASLPPWLFDAVICNQVIQYVEYPSLVLKEFAELLRPCGHLLLTYHGNWAEVEDTDLWRFTKAGMETLLKRVGFTIVAHELRAEVVIGNFRFPTGWGVVCRK